MNRHYYLLRTLRCNVCCLCVCYSLSHIRLCATPWTVAHQAPLSMGFSQQEYWSGLPLFPSPGDLPDPGIEPCLPQHMKILYHLSHQGRSHTLHTYIIKSLVFFDKLHTFICFKQNSNLRI